MLLGSGRRALEGGSSCRSLDLFNTALSGSWRCLSSPPKQHEESKGPVCVVNWELSAKCLVLARGGKGR